MSNINRDPITPIVVQLGVGIANILANIPAGYHYQIVSASIVNVNAAARTVQIHLHPDTVAAAAANALAYDLSINGNSLYNLVFGMPMIIPSGYRISGLCSHAASVNVVLTGYIINDAIQ